MMHDIPLFTPSELNPTQWTLDAARNKGVVMTIVPAGVSADTHGDSPDFVAAINLENKLRELRWPSLMRLRVRPCLEHDWLCLFEHDIEGEWFHMGLAVMFPTQEAGTLIKLLTQAAATVHPHRLSDDNLIAGSFHLSHARPQGRTAELLPLCNKDEEAQKCA